MSFPSESNRNFSSEHARGQYTPSLPSDVGYLQFRQPIWACNPGGSLGSQKSAFSWQLFKDPKKDFRLSIDQKWMLWANAMTEREEGPPRSRWNYPQAESERSVKPYFPSHESWLTNSRKASTGVGQKTGSNTFEGWGLRNVRKSRTRRARISRSAKDQQYESAFKALSFKQIFDLWFVSVLSCYRCFW